MVADAPMKLEIKRDYEGSIVWPDRERVVFRFHILPARYGRPKPLIVICWRGISGCSSEFWNVVARAPPIASEGAPYTQPQIEQPVRTEIKPAPPPFAVGFHHFRDSREIAPIFTQILSKALGFRVRPWIEVATD